MEKDFHTIELELVRGSAGLGFHINGGTDKPCLPHDPGIFVSKLRNAGAAVDDGRLQAGDKIIEANSVKSQQSKGCFRYYVVGLGILVVVAFVGYRYTKK